MQHSAACASLLLSLLQTVAGASSMVYIADTHLGEGCATADSGYQLNDTNCYSFRHLNATVQKINAVIASRSESRDPVRIVLVGGDITSSAQLAEFVAAKSLLDQLIVPYLPLMGNHDIWSYDEVSGDLTPTPAADGMFAAVFAPVFKAAASLGELTYPNASAFNPQRNCTSQWQSWELRPRRLGPDLERMILLAPDFNTRQRAPPPCPGHSRFGGCGVPGKAELHDFDDGVMPWFESRLDALANGNASMPDGIVLLLTHQPFRCREGVPDWSFCFSSQDKATLRSAIEARGLRDAFWGQLAGHQHRWWNGSAFDEVEWLSFRQWENSAVKGDQFHAAMASSFSVIRVSDARMGAITRYWQENGVWKEDDAAVLGSTGMA